MNRGMFRGDHGNSSGLHRMTQSTDQGPLMTEHLHNLDLELELLRRKREMIEQQQQLLNEQIQRPYDFHDFDQPRYYEQEHYDRPESSSHRNYSHLYDPKDSHDFIPLSSSRKRPNDNKWDDEAVPKRFSSPKHDTVKKSFDPWSRPLYESSRNEINTNRHVPTPLMNLNTYPPMRSHKFASKPKPIRKDFKPTKVSKPKVSPPNNLGSKPAAERKHLVAQASNLVKKVDDSSILHPDREPSVQLTGRLELALGQIWKDVKRLSSNKPTESQQPQRLMKQIIRERIRSLMLGKVVGPFKEVLDAYRAAYPPHTDEDIVKAAMDAQTNTDSKTLGVEIVESENPETFFKVNVNKLVEVKLREMFDKLEEIYLNPLEKKISDKKSNGKVAQGIDFTQDLTDEEIKESSGQTEDKTKEYTFSIDQLDNMIQWRLPRILKRFIPFLTKVLYADQIYESTRAAVIMKTNSKALALVKMVEKMEKTMTENITEPKETKQEMKAETPVQEKSDPPRYFIKILGRPTLPKRKVMQTFLEQFQPKTIKKHKNIYNLLFVGFDNKENFNKMLSENGVILGKSTLEIKVSEAKVNPTKSLPKTNIDDDVQIIENEGNIIKLDDTFGSDNNPINTELDEQITDLLTSIRQAEEKEQSKTGDGEIAIEEETIHDNKIENDGPNVIIDVDNDTSDSQTNNYEKRSQNDVKVAENEPETQKVTNEENVVDNDDVELVKVQEHVTNNAKDPIKNNYELHDEVEHGREDDKIAHEEDKDAHEEDKISHEADKDVYEKDKIAHGGDKDVHEEDKIAHGGDKDVHEEDKIAHGEDKDVHEEDKIAYDGDKDVHEEDKIAHVGDKNVHEGDKIAHEGDRDVHDGDKIANEIVKDQLEKNEELETNDVVEKLKGEKENGTIGRSTPTRTSARLANVTPSTIRTRRASRLAQN